VAAESATDTRLSLVLSSSAIQNSLSLSSPCVSLVTSFFMRKPVRRPLRTIISREASAASSELSLSEACGFCTGSNSAAAITRFRNCTGLAVISRPVPWRVGVMRLLPTCHEGEGGRDEEFGSASAREHGTPGVSTKHAVQSKRWQCLRCFADSHLRSVGENSLQLVLRVGAAAGRLLHRVGHEIIY
jgi:hypothetical protein